MSENLLSEILRLFSLPGGQRYLVQTPESEFKPSGGTSYETLLTLKTEDMAAHLRGEKTVALSLVNPASLARVMVLDFDGHAHGHGERDWSIIRNLVGTWSQELGLPAPAVACSGRKGYGVWWGLAEPLPASQLRAFVHFLKKAYFPEVPKDEMDLRPDTDKPTLAALANAKLPPCKHQANGKWAAFLDMEWTTGAPAPGFDDAPDLDEQANILSAIQPIATVAFLAALEKLRAKAGQDYNTADNNAPKHKPDLSKMGTDEHPACIQVMVEKGAPHSMQYNTANLNLANYTRSRGLSKEAGEALARRMAEVSTQEAHPTSKDTVAAKLKSFKSNQTGPDFHCDYPRNTPSWREHFNASAPIIDVCRKCPACPSSLFGSDKPSSHTENKKDGKTYFGNTLTLEEPVALELLAWAWRTGEPLHGIRRVWPEIEYQEGEREAVGLPFALIAAEASDNGHANAAGFFSGLDVFLSTAGYRKGPADTAMRKEAKEKGEAFLARLSASNPSDEDGKAAMVRAQHLERRAILAEHLEDASKRGPEVSANVLAGELRAAVEGVLRDDKQGGPLSSLRQHLFDGFTRADAIPTIATPWARLTRLLHGGWRSGRLYVLLAPPKAGKTTLVAQAMDHAAANGHPTLYVGYEMSREQLVEYALARKLGINSRSIEMRHLTRLQARQVAEALDDYLANEGQYLEVWEAGFTTAIPDVEAWVVKAKAQHPDKTPLVVIDYLQLARTGLREIDGHQSETKRVSTVAVMCKDLARRSGAAVIALSSITKEGDRETRSTGALDVNAARDSMAIINAADGVLTLNTSHMHIPAKTKGEDPELVDPWNVMVHQLEAEGDVRRSQDLARGIERISHQYPQKGLFNAGRARITLERHRGSTGDVPVYYERALHRVDEVSIPGLYSLEEADNGAPAEVADVFRTYVNTESHNSDIRQPAVDTPAPPVDASAFEGLDEELEAFEFAGAVKEPVPYRLITSFEEAQSAIGDLVQREEFVGVDTETTGLSPQDGAQARLLQIAPHDGPVLVIDLAKTGGAHHLAGLLGSLHGVAHNAAFDMKFLACGERRPVILDCTMLAHHTLTGKMDKLSSLASTYLGLEMDKAEQKSDWSGELSESQLAYAALDARNVLRLFPEIMEKVKERDSERVYNLMRQAQRSVVPMELAGMPFDAEAQKVLLDRLTIERDQHREKLKAELGDMNPNSGAQLGEWLSGILGGDASASYKAWPKTAGGKLATGANDLLKGLRYLPMPTQILIRETLLPYKDVEKSINAFGESLERHISPVTGRIHASFKIAGTTTGRFSCSGPNLQQIPRDKDFRALFKAPEGRRFAIADYSQMELRVAAIVAGEEKLLQAYREGRDTHALTAAMILSKKPEDVTKAERQLAKAVNFGLLYGQSARGLQEYAANSYGVEISESQARGYREAWFKSYPAFEAWHTRTSRTSKRTQSIRTPSGRERRFGQADDYRDTKAYNTPVQGGAAEAMLAALGILPDYLGELDATPVAVVHDEVIIEASEADAADAAAALEEAMVQGMLAVFPDASTNGLVEAHTGGSWADK